MRYRPPFEHDEVGRLDDRRDAQATNGPHTIMFVAFKVLWPYTESSPNSVAASRPITAWVGGALLVFVRSVRLQEQVSSLVGKDPDLHTAVNGVPPVWELVGFGCTHCVETRLGLMGEGSVPTLTELETFSTCDGVRLYPYYL